MSEQLVRYESEDKISIITMNRPAKLNAVNGDMKAALVSAFKQADDDPATSVVILRGEGRSFCVGYDIGRMDDPARASWRHDPVRWHAHLRESVRFELVPWDMRKPVIAQVQGHALGGGCQLAMTCDFTIAAEDALFGEPEVRFSNVGPAIVMPWFIGLKKARELLFFGDTIDAATALDLGMVNRVVAADHLAEATLRFARRLTLVSPEALYCAKLAINRGVEAAGFRNAVNVGLDVVAPLYATKTEAGQQFKDIAAADGLAAALKWRGDQFRE
jgi:enoyl-CoA hydratase